MLDNSEILRHKLERIVSIEYQIKKSLSDDFNYGVRNKVSENTSDSSLFVEKTGAEIKTAIEKDKKLCSEQTTSLVSMMDAAIKEIGVQPTGSYKGDNDYIVRDWIGKIDLPMKYQYEQIYQQDVMNQNVPANKKMLEYNEMSRKLICLSIEQKKLQTIINALNDKKSYKLTIDIASKLGF